jgi:hypothetical protein
VVFRLVVQNDPGDDVDELRDAASGSWETFVEAQPAAAARSVVTEAVREVPGLQRGETGRLPPAEVPGRHLEPHRAAHFDGA